MRIKIAEPWFDGLPPIMEFCCTSPSSYVNEHLKRPFRVPGGIAATDNRIVARLMTDEAGGLEPIEATRHIPGVIDDLAAMVYEPLTFPAFGTIPVQEECRECCGPQQLPLVPIEVSPNAFFAHAYLQRLRMPDIESVGLSMVERDHCGAIAATIRFTFAGGMGVGFLAGMDHRQFGKLPAWRLGSAAMFFHPDRV